MMASSALFENKLLTNAEKIGKKSYPIQYHYRIELRILRGQLYSGGDNSERSLEAISKKEKEFKSAESAALNVISVDLAVELIDELKRISAHSKMSSGGFVDRVMIAEIQADKQIHC
jgi:hypothetical protein